MKTCGVSEFPKSKEKPWATWDFAVCQTGARERRFYSQQQAAQTFSHFNIPPCIKLNLKAVRALSAYTGMTNLMFVIFGFMSWRVRKRDAMLLLFACVLRSLIGHEGCFLT
jgi:hypothetical protein